MLKRELALQLKEGAKYYPVLTLTGPRQSGKTTLVKEVFAGYDYVNLEDHDTLSQIMFDPKKFIRNQKDPIIIDEVQNYPELLSYIQVYVDENPIKGKFILTRSHQFSLLDSVSQSLAGRTDILTLYPLSFTEVRNINKSIEGWMLSGFYPRVIAGDAPSDRNSRNYIQTYVERDVRKIVYIKDIHSFRQLIKLCAGRVGGELNINNLSNETGVSHNTIKSWIGILEASHLIYLLQPYYENLGKRMIKSPKLYFVDVGLACHLLGISTNEHLALHPLRGMLFENMVVMDFIKNQINRGNMPQVYFYRDNNQNEVDLIFDQAGKLIPIEIKSSETFNRRFLNGVEYFMKLTPKAEKGYLVYAGTPIGGSDKVKILNYKNTSEILDS